jgi:hypothetical protein
MKYATHVLTHEPGSMDDEIAKAFDPSEPRDDKGQWTENPSGGLGDAGSGDHPEIGTPFIKHMPEAQGKAVVKYEAELLIRNRGARGGEGKERMVIVRPDGDIALDKEGTKNHVSFSTGHGSDVERIQSIPGCVGTHNHPADGGFSLSPADVSTAGQIGLSEIRAVGMDATYSMKPLPGKKWPSPRVMQIAYDNATRPLIDAAKKRAVEKFAPELAKLDRTDRAALREYNKGVTASNHAENWVIQHATWLKAAPLLGLHYTRILRKKS